MHERDWTRERMRANVIGRRRHYGEACGGAEAAAAAAAAGHTVDDGSPVTYFYYAVSVGGKGAVCRGDDVGTTSRLYDIDAEVGGGGRA